MDVPRNSMHLHIGMDRAGAFPKIRWRWYYIHVSDHITTSKKSYRTRWGASLAAGRWASRNLEVEEIRTLQNYSPSMRPESLAAIYGHPPLPVRISK